MIGERLHAGVVVEEGRSILAAGSRGVYRLVRGAWSKVPLPGGVSSREVRGIGRSAGGELLLFGEGGLAGALSSRGTFRRLTAADRDTVWFAAHADDLGITLVGERTSRPCGVALVMPNEGAPWIYTIEATGRLTAVTRLPAGPLLAVGTQGVIVAIDERGVHDVPWARTGHLYAIGAGAAGPAFAVGSGGHALRIERLGGDVVATLEGVQTTRDLFAVAVDPGTGSAWAAGSDARLLERRGDAWIRVPLDAGVTSPLIHVAARAARIMVLGEDGGAYFYDT